MEQLSHSSQGMRYPWNIKSKSVRSLGAEAVLPQKAFDRLVGVSMRGLYVDVESVHFFLKFFRQFFFQVFNGLFSLSLCFFSHIFVFSCVSLLRPTRARP